MKPNHFSFPDFIGIGMKKTGTSFIAGLLDQHPDIALANPRITNYWITDQLDGSYNRFFPHLNPGQKTLEWGEYTNHPIALEHFSRLGQQATYLLSYRSPKSILFSWYNYTRMLATPSERKITFEQSFNKDRDAYLELVNLDIMLQRFREACPTARIIVIDYEYLAHDSSGLTAELYTALGVRHHSADLTNIWTNQSLVPKSMLLDRAWRKALKTMYPGKIFRKNNDPQMPLLFRFIQRLNSEKFYIDENMNQYIDENFSKNHTAFLDACESDPNIIHLRKNDDHRFNSE
ncbi:MAG: hypothetical protein CL398_01705 [Acidiferrobacteraceae bacterium]|nr:hypothetical protein [Acidiferrobacteraceae bacterium]|tara:strand:+ start:1307 stop:2176 length:870 start_codon:yes stop_codon:yes gene_type:complete